LISNFNLKVKKTDLKAEKHEHEHEHESITHEMLNMKVSHMNMK